MKLVGGAIPCPSRDSSRVPQHAAVLRISAVGLVTQRHIIIIHGITAQPLCRRQLIINVITGVTRTTVSTTSSSVAAKPGIKRISLSSSSILK